ncbi:Gfo/Idh/MocA family oxidoreductase [Pelagicoccus mobilis]|uniref:Gfo/Idh/MocA family oxidoreductase n=1 Tax=Pelagicoccus mobilis TaxID=415221 RepID=A0A934VLD8_9BACT|nr:Gfo/Idh/MocA family oxidoreductase [Pelagicoccus mobilis]MBK1877641.1 Gfo/Idh/MocA family oxidoreductase [Pelagicoccus mobilis]
MSSRFSFITANLVAETLDYHMTDGWMQGDNATNEYYRPIETYEERFGAMLEKVKMLGFSAIDLWAAHLHFSWATLEHVETAKRLLQEKGMVARSYAAWVGDSSAELKATCRVCKELGMRYISGHIEFVNSDRTAAVEILRSFGVGYAIENHTETSIEILRARLGEGDEDVMGIALDLGWCGTREWDALEGLKELYDRIFTVHLKDVKAKRSEPTGYEFIDMGHETCLLGEGIVPVEAVLKELRRRDFRGSIGVEHEPEKYDPTDEIREGLSRAEKWWTEAEPVVENPLKVVIVGCGNIANAYGEALAKRPEIVVLGAQDLDTARAEEWVGTFGGKAYETLDEVLADDAVEAVINLTIQAAHFEVVSKCLEAGKQVHSEKPLAPTYVEAKQLVELAKEKGLRLSCAPATWLGESQQTAKRLIEEGAIGKPKLAYVNVDWGRIEGWHPAPAGFYKVGALADVGVYPITLLTKWFGPVKSVLADGAKLLPERRDKDGKAFELEREDWMSLVLEFRSGFRARLTASFYVGLVEGSNPAYEIHGDDGALKSNWFAATAPIELGKNGEGFKTVKLDSLPIGEGAWYCDWSAGVYGLWKALREGGAHPTTGEQAAHVVEVVEAAHAAIAEGRSVELESEF